MSLTIYMERLRFLDSLIRRKATGRPETLSKKMNLSRSQAMAFIQELKEYGFPIEYSRKIESYYYTKDVRLFSKLFYVKNNFEKKEPETLPKDIMRQIIGGKTFFTYSFLRPIISDGND